MAKRKHAYTTSVLFPKNSFLIGMGCAFNLFGNYYSFNYSKTSKEADERAIRNDWDMIGQDMRNALKEYHSKHTYPSL